MSLWRRSGRGSYDGRGYPALTPVSVTQQGRNGYEEEKRRGRSDETRMIRLMMTVVIIPVICLLMGNIRSLDLDARTARHLVASYVIRT